VHADRSAQAGAQRAFPTRRVNSLRCRNALVYARVHNVGMSYTVQKIKDKLSIVDVVSQYVKLERNGANFRARCPFHAERTPSFFVSPDRGTYHCFGCDAGGDIFTFVEQIEGLDFKGALKILAEKAGVEIVYEHPGAGGREKKDESTRLFELLETAAIFYTSRLNEPVEKYLKERGINNETIRTFRLGLAGSAWSECSEYLRERTFTDKEIVDAGVAKLSPLGKGDKGLIDKFRNRIMFPIADSAGRIVGFSGRIFGSEAHPDAPKYLNSPETLLFRKSRVLHGFDRAKQAMRKHNCAILVEGQMDLLASNQAGWTNTVAASGTAFTPEHAALIRRIADNLVIALDPDEAGLKAAARAARTALHAGLNVKVAEASDGLDPADLIQKKGANSWRDSIREAKDIITFLLDVLEKHAKSTDQFRRSVESVVLPFLSDVSSPIARESYLREIARRLSVSESAVAEALAKVPVAREASATGASINTGDSRKERSSFARKPMDHGRAKQAYAIFLWQQSLEKPIVNINKFAKDLSEALGVEAFSVLGTLSEDEKESLRFRAESMYGKNTTLKREVEALLHVISHERLSADLREATAALKNAEVTGNEEDVAVYMSVCKLLTARIAQLHEPV